MECFIGQIATFGFNFAPSRWSFCAGNILNITQNTALFSLLGTTYGGNGQTTFGLPDLRGRIPVHAAGTFTLGEIGGSENVTLSSAQMPAHTHPFNVTNANANEKPDPTYIFAQGYKASPPTSNPKGYNAGPPNIAMAAGMISSAGGSQPHPNLQPYLCLNYCIAMYGIYPARN
jgi:microcystin-dependent protein